MEGYFSYIIKATCCLSLFYVASMWLFRNNTSFMLQRMYLIGSVILALLLPFNKLSMGKEYLNLSLIVQNTANFVKTETRDAKPNPFNAMEENKSQPVSVSNKVPASLQASKKSTSLTDVLIYTYWSIAGLFVLRLIYSMLYILFYFFRSKRKKTGPYTIIYSTSITSSFSFLHWIFVNEELKDDADYRDILNHEIVHAAQYHSLDTIMIELLSAVMWFNPFIWLMRRWMQQLHEYLADEGVVKSGTSVLEYQALLVNQVAGDRLICLPSGFNQSLIKKRLTMMTKTKTKQKTGYRLLALLPLTGLMFLSLSFTNRKETQVTKPIANTTVLTISYPAKQTKPVIEVKQKENQTSHSSSVIHGDSSKKVITAIAVSPDKMNVFYIGVDNPVTVAVSNIAPEKVTVTIDNGNITGSNGSYIVHPKQPGRATVKVFDGDKQIGTWEFRVKTTPDPVAKVAGKKGGVISMEELLKAEKVIADLENFDFDARFTVVEFTISIMENGFNRELTSKSIKITEDQKKLIQSRQPGDRIVFNDIKAVGPDGKIRQLNGIIFKIQDPKQPE